ncbi:MAG TPA: hypothetical protein VML75_12245 [Kofleriaceae bacterium]|nr:hypothetical protein [Kofleriaceae bacterium]
MLTRPIAWALAASFAAHAVVLLWIQLTEEPVPRPPPREENRRGELATVVEIQPLEVELLEPVAESDASAVRPAAVAHDTAPPRLARRDRRELGDSAPGEVALPGAAITAPPAPRERDEPLRGEPPAAPSPAELARRMTPELGPPPPRSPLAPPRSRRPPRAPPSEIRSDGTGEYQSDDLTFDARVARDGTVTFDDHSDFSAHVALPGARDIARHLQSWTRDPYGTSVGAPESSALDTKTDAARDPGGPADEFKENSKRTIPIVGGRFNFDDWITRKGGVDPYIARKAAYLDRTRGERTRMAAVARDEHLREAVTRLRAHLTRVWGYQAWTPVQRRRALFELWDECAERGAANVVEAGATARATIEAFIRRELAAGTAHAFTDAELARLNQVRQSGRAFAPYR